MLPVHSCRGLLNRFLVFVSKYSIFMTKKDLFTSHYKLVTTAIKIIEMNHLLKTLLQIKAFVNNLTLQLFL